MHICYKLEPLSQSAFYHGCTVRHSMQPLLTGIGKLPCGIILDHFGCSDSALKMGKEQSCHVHEVGIGVDYGCEVTLRSKTQLNLG